MASDSSLSSRLADLSCGHCGAVVDASAHATCPACSGPLACRYDLDGLAGRLPAAPAGSPAGLFRWAPLLPVREPARRLVQGEGDTPEVKLPRLAAELGLAELAVKDEGLNPLGSFKTRGMTVAIAAHAERGARAVVLPSAGNAGAAAAALARRHGLACRVALPAAATSTHRAQARLVGARTVAVSGDLRAAGAWVDGHATGGDEHVLSTFREPFRVEGQKTLAFEIWEAGRGRLPDVIVVPTGGGVAVAGLDKGFAELAEAGLLDAPPPRLVAAQVESCCPLVRALEAGAEDVAPWPLTRRTLAEGLRVPDVAGGRLVLAALRRCGGAAVAVAEPDLLHAVRRAARADAVLLGAEGGVAMAAVLALADGPTLAGRRVLVLNTGSLLLSPEALAAAAAG